MKKSARKPITLKLAGTLLVAALVVPGAVAQSANTATSRSNTQHNVAADTAVAKCVDAAGKPCTSAHVRDLSTGMTTGRRQHKALAAVKSVTLASSDGTLKCEQNDGKPCTEEQVLALNEIAGSMKLGITYNSSHSNTGNRTAAPTKSDKD